MNHIPEILQDTASKLKTIFSDKRVISLLLLLLALPLTFLLVKRQMSLRVPAKVDTVNLYFYPSTVELSSINQEETLNIIANLRANQIAFARVSFSFDPQKIELTRIVPTELMSNVISTTPLEKANTSGYATFVLTALPQENTLTELVRLASITVKLKSQNLNDSTSIRFSITDSQIVDVVDEKAATLSSSEANILLNSNTSLSTNSDANYNFSSPPNIVFGQRDYTQTSSNMVTTSKSYHPGGVVFDNNRNVAYVFDSSNNRVLGFNSLGYCGSTDNQILSVSSVHNQDLAAENIFDGYYNVECNSHEWGTDIGDKQNQYIEFSVNSGLTLDSIKLYDRLCSQTVEGYIELNNNSGMRYPFGSFGSNIEKTVAIGRSGINRARIVISNVSPSGDNVGLGEVKLIYSYNNAVKCTSATTCSSGQQCSIQKDVEAKLVFGQPGLTDYSASNQNNRVLNNPTASTLSLHPYPNVITPAESGLGSQMSVDTDGNLYVLDPMNNRVLRYNNPFSNMNTEADHVWGQTNFTSRIENAGLGAVNNRGIHTDGYGAIYATGVYIDSGFNLWVTDAENGRVLRFPDSNGDRIPDANANLVLGQENMTTGNTTCGGPNNTQAPLNKMCNPISILVDDNGAVYILEAQNFYDSNIGEWSRTRLLRFTPPLSNGMAAASSWLYGGQYSQNPENSIKWGRGITFSQGKASIYINDHGNNRVLEVNKTNGSIIRVVGQNNLSETSCGPLCENHGGIGIDANGNLLIAVNRSDQMRVARYNRASQTFDGNFLYGPNKITGNRFKDFSGFLAYNNTLYVSDGRNRRVLIWNNYNSRGAGDDPIANYVIGPDGFESSNPSYLWDGSHIAIDKNGDPAGTPVIWMGRGNGDIIGYKLPITQNKGPSSTPDYIITSDKLKRVDNGSRVELCNSINGIAYDNTNSSQNDSLWIVQGPLNRTMRIRNIYSQTPQVDIALGNSNLSSCTPQACTNPTQNSLCGPSYATFDRSGNLFITDTNYEGREGEGNLRLLRYNAGNIVNSGSTLRTMLNADDVYTKESFTTRECYQPAGAPERVGPCNPIFPSFDNKGNMYLVDDSYLSPQFRRVYVYENYMSGNPPHLPSYSLPIPLGQGMVSQFDEYGNWLLQDHTWNTIMLFRPTAPITPTPTLTQQQQCESGRGLWELRTCDDPCNTEAQKCDLNLFYVCNCGAGSCWNGTNCVNTPITPERQACIDDSFGEWVEGGCVDACPQGYCYMNGQIVEYCDCSGFDYCTGDDCMGRNFCWNGTSCTVVFTSTPTP